MLILLSDPDMLEVGNMDTYEQSRAHFGAWCIVSSPLILGHDLTNEVRFGMFCYAMFCFAVLRRASRRVSSPEPLVFFSGRAGTNFFRTPMFDRPQPLRSGTLLPTRKPSPSISSGPDTPASW